MVDRVEKLQNALEQMGMNNITVIPAVGGIKFEYTMVPGKSLDFEQVHNMFKAVANNYQQDGKTAQAAWLNQLNDFLSEQVLTDDAMVVTIADALSTQGALFDQLLDKGQQFNQLGEVEFDLPDVADKDGNLLPDPARWEAVAGRLNDLAVLTGYTDVKFHVEKPGVIAYSSISNVDFATTDIQVSKLMDKIIRKDESLTNIVGYVDDAGERIGNDVIANRQVGKPGQKFIEFDMATGHHPNYVVDLIENGALAIIKDTFINNNGVDLDAFATTTVEENPIETPDIVETKLVKSHDTYNENGKEAVMKEVTTIIEGAKDIFDTSGLNIAKDGLNIGQQTQEELIKELQDAGVGVQPNGSFDNRPAKTPNTGAAISK